MSRQEKDFVRRQLTEAESLVSQASQQRSKAQELETALQYSNEKIRLLTDSKSALDSQLLVTARDAEGNKYKIESLSIR
jgi:hypothetical protein